MEELRVLIPDIDPNNQIYSDTELTAFMTAARGNLFRAASLAIGSLSVDEAITYKVIKTDDQSINGAAVADALRKRAQDLEFLARREDDITREEDSFSVSYPHPQILSPELIPMSPNDLPYWGVWQDLYGNR